MARPSTRLTRATFRVAVDTLCVGDPALARVVERHGRPALWSRPEGFATLILLILEQQVSLASAMAAYVRLERRLAVVEPGPLLELDDDELRAVGFSRQKTRYARALSTAVESGALRLEQLRDAPDDEARAQLTALPGIGPWTADVYLLACLGRPDVWPVGDVALQAAAAQVIGLETRPTAAELADHGERWRPFRSVAAQLLWHHYLGERHTRAPAT